MKGNIERGLTTMTIIETIRKIFGKKHVESISEILDKMDNTATVQTFGNRSYARLWAIADIDNSFKVVRDGFTTKAEAKAYCETVSINWYLYPYEIEIK